MEIRINTITLHNFKGAVGDRSFRFDGRNARIEGDNGTGKSTVFDAFTWLLFGKDHLGQDWTRFDIKPIDPETRSAVTGLDCTAVEAELSVDGSPRTLRRVITEDWVKPRGEATRILKGHTQTFYVDGVACATKKEYDSAVHALIGEDVFRIVTNPHYLIDNSYTDWKVRRKVILDAVGYDPRAVDGDFADLVAEMEGRKLEDFRKVVAARKKAQREALATAGTNITAWRTALPEEADEEEIRSAIESLKAGADHKAGAVRADIEKVDRALADAAGRNAAAEKAADEKNARIRALRIKMQDYIADAVNAARKARNARKETISALEYELVAARDRRRRIDSTLESYRQGLAEDSARLQRLGTEYEAARASTFVDEGKVCPVCGRPLDGEKLRADWMEEKRAQLRRIQEKVPPIRAEIASWKESIGRATEDLAAMDGKIAELTAQLDAAQERITAGEDRPDDQVEMEARRSEEFRAMVAMLTDLEDEAREAAGKTESTAGLLEKRRDLEASLTAIRGELEESIRPLQDALAVAGERKRILALIAEEEERQRTYAAELARLERLEVRTLEYIKASIDACEGAINARFREARWKMFDRTLDGGIVEMCEVTTREGVPYASMNSAARILCGMEVIRVVGEANGVKAPIFVDNAESVTRRDFIPGAQVIRLVVKEGSKLNTVTE